MSDGMECTSCGETHDQWTEKDTKSTPPGHRGGQTAWECERCGDVELVDEY